MTIGPASGVYRGEEHVFLDPACIFPPPPREKITFTPAWMVVGRQGGQVQLIIVVKFAVNSDIGHSIAIVLENHRQRKEN